MLYKNCLLYPSLKRSCLSENFSLQRRNSCIPFPLRKRSQLSGVSSVTFHMVDQAVSMTSSQMPAASFSVMMKSIFSMAPSRPTRRFCWPSTWQQESIYWTIPVSHAPPQVLWIKNYLFWSRLRLRPFRNFQIRLQPTRYRYIINKKN